LSELVDHDQVRTTPSRRAPEIETVAQVAPRDELTDGEGEHAPSGEGRHQGLKSGRDRRF
jgi:hypothetical protein